MTTPDAPTPMTSEEWQAANSRYLAASLRWLRLRLERLIPGESMVQPVTPVSPATTVPTQGGFWHHFFNDSAPLPEAGALPLLPEARLPLLEEQIAQAQAERNTIVASMQSAPALVTLARQFGLTAFEQDTLLLCLSMELDMRMAGLCARAQGDADRSYPTFALAMTALDQPSWDALTPERPLRYWRMVEINQPAATPLTLSALRADERIVAFVKGLNRLDDRLAALLIPVTSPAQALAPSQLESARSVLDQWQLAPDARPLPLAQLIGTNDVSKLWIAQACAMSIGRYLYRLDAEILPSQHSELEWLARLWQRESVMLPLALFVDAQHLDPGMQGPGALKRFLHQVVEGTAPVFLGVREALPALSQASFTVETRRPAPAEQRDAWLQALPLDLDDADAQAVAARLVGQFDLDLPEIQQMAAAHGSDLFVEDEPGEDENKNQKGNVLWDACAVITRPRLDALAQRLTPKATWNDLVLPDEQCGLLRLIAAQVQQRSAVYLDWGFAERMNRGFGISVLFAGESGTGKTMAAEVMANALRLNLYRIDLSAVVSKYIGETEKNLRQLFDAADAGGAILLFDEADALFGKRSEVKDSHDRYANIEINYLLQRMEVYRGLAILATNMKSALDTAFMRRLRFIVNFPFPGVNERKNIWTKAFPGAAPVKDLDFGRLARLNLTGGNIHSIAVNAAFLAAQRGERITMPVVLAVARMEYRKLDKPINEVDFR